MRRATALPALDDGVDEPAVLLVVVGLVLAVAGTAHELTTPADRPIAALSVAGSLLVPAAVATGGYWLLAVDTSDETRWRVVTWASAGIVAACALGISLYVLALLGDGQAGDLWSHLARLASGGSAIGFVAGLSVGSENPSTVGSTIGREVPSGGEETNDGESATDEPEVDESGDERDDSRSPAGTDGSGERGFVPLDASVGEPVYVDGEEFAIEPAVDPADAAVDANAGSGLEPSRPGETPARVPRTAALTLDVLRDDRARVALAIVYDAGKPLSVDALARAVADRTNDGVDETAIALRRETLCKLEAAYAIEWDPRAETIAAPEHAIFEEGVREVRALLEPFEPGTR